MDPPSSEIGMRKFIFWGVCAVAVFLPVAYGSMEEWAVFAFEAAVALLFAAYWLGAKGGERGEGSDAKVLPLFLKAFLAAFFVLSAISIIPLPAAVVSAISPQAAALRAGLAPLGLEAYGGGAWMTLSLAPSASLYILVKYAAYGMFAFLVFRAVRTRKQVEIVFWVLAATAVFETAYGIAQVFGGTERIFSYQKKWSLGSVTGTFINRNHLAGFLEMIFPLVLGYLLAKADFFAMGRRATLRERIVWFGQEKLQRTIIVGLVAAVIGLGLVFSRSRSGVLIFLITIFLMIIALSAAGTGGGESVSAGSGRRGRRLLRTIGLVVVFAAVLIGVRPVIERFTKEKVTFEVGRPVYFRYAAKIIRDFPLAGTGPGTFVYAYQKYEETDNRAIVDHAHNDYLEILAENGIPAGGMLWIFLFGVFGIGFARWVKRRDPFVKGVGLGCLGGLAAIFLHSLTDFNLQVTANGALFCALAALLLRVTGLENRRAARDSNG